MAVVPICSRMCYKDQTPFSNEIRGYTINEEAYGAFSRVSSHTSGRACDFYNTTDILNKAKRRDGIDNSQGVMQSRNSLPFNIKSEASVISRIPKFVSQIRSISANASKREKVSRVWNALESNSREKHLGSLDSYFGKLNKDVSRPSSRSLNKTMELRDSSGQSRDKKELGPVADYVGKSGDKSSQFRAQKELGSPVDYLAKVSEDAKSRNHLSSASDDETTEAAAYAVKGGFRSRVKLNNYRKSQNKDAQGGPKSSYDETSSLYLISIIVSINIAVFLFEIASPVRNSDLGLFSLPSLYGAKINHLILIGEWWRLVTPMFLHSGILHVGLGCWVLLTFGPHVCRAYGSFTFFLIYILGGLSGNLTSYLHTPVPTVGGTGPTFALIGAWLIYQYQNRDIIGKDAFESLFQKAIAATAFGFILSSSGPIDDWSHFGAAITGIAYGFLTCPTLQMDDKSSETAGQEEGITLVGRQVNSCKSLAFFSLFILILSLLLFIVEPPLILVAEDTLV